MTVKIRTTCRPTLCRLCGKRIDADATVAIVGHYRPAHPACAIRELTRRRAKLTNAITRIRREWQIPADGPVVGTFNGEPVVLTGSGA